MTVKYSEHYEAVRSRLRRLPLLLEESVYGLVKKDVIGINKTFHDGIKNNKLRLEKLHPGTVDSKRRKGYKKPNSPLYGMGDDADIHAYANMMNIKKIHRGWKLYPSWRKHHSSKLNLRQLFMVHEHGALIRKKEKSGKITIIRIPPRPALQLSYLKYLAEKSKSDRENSIKVKNGIKDFVTKGKTKILNELRDFNDQEINK